MGSGRVRRDLLETQFWDNSISLPPTPRHTSKGMQKALSCSIAREMLLLCNWICHLPDGGAVCCRCRRICVCWLCLCLSCMTTFSDTDPSFLPFHRCCLDFDWPLLESKKRFHVPLLLSNLHSWHQLKIHKAQRWKTINITTFRMTYTCLLKLSVYFKRPEWTKFDKLLACWILCQFSLTSSLEHLSTAMHSAVHRCNRRKVNCLDRQVWILDAISTAVDLDTSIEMRRTNQLPAAGCIDRQDSFLSQIQNIAAVL